MGGMMGGGGSVSAPAPRNLTKEMLQTYQGYAATAAPYFNIESLFQPKYRQLDLANLQQQLFGYDVPGQSGQPTTISQPGGVNWAQAQTTEGGTPALANQGTPFMLNRFGTRVGGQGAGPIPGTNLIQMPGRHGRTFVDPYAGAARNAPSQTPGHHPGTIELGTLANTATRTADINDVRNLGPAAMEAFLAANPGLADSLSSLRGRLSDSPLLSSLNESAMTGLNSENYLSPQEARASTQAARGALQGQGLARSGNPAISAEILNRDASWRGRQAQERQFAEGVQGLNAQQGDFVNNAARTFSSTLGDPFQMILSRGSGAGSLSPTSPRQFDPQSPYAADLYNTNFNSQAAANIAGANQSAAKGGGTMQTIGSVVGAVAAAY